MKGLWPFEQLSLCFSLLLLIRSEHSMLTGHPCTRAIHLSNKPVVGTRHNKEPTIAETSWRTGSYIFRVATGRSANLTSQPRKVKLHFHSLRRIVGERTAVFTCPISLAGRLRHDNVVWRVSALRVAVPWSRRDCSARDKTVRVTLPGNNPTVIRQGAFPQRLQNPVIRQAACGLSFYRPKCGRNKISGYQIKFATAWYSHCVETQTTYVNRKLILAKNRLCGKFYVTPSVQPEN
jgi:hypothetical protein